MSEPTRGNKGTGQAPDQSKGVTGADGASANGQQNGRPNSVDGGQSTARTAAAAAREKAAKKPAPKAAPQGGGLGSAIAAAAGDPRQSGPDGAASGTRQQHPEHEQFD